MFKKWVLMQGGMDSIFPESFMVWHLLNLVKSKFTHCFIIKGISDFKENGKYV